MDESYGHYYRELYERHWWWRAREAAVLEELHRIRPSRGWGRILDVGCGDALFFPKLSAMGEVEGVEVDERLISTEAQSRGLIHTVPFDQRFQPGRRYGLILMLDVLEHIEDPISALAKAVELLDSGGTVLVTVPAFRAVWTGHDELNHHHRRYTQRSFRAVAEAARFQIFTRRYFFHWVFVAKLFVRVAEALLRPEPRIPHIPPPWTNSLLERICAIERRLLGRLPVPFGSSLLIVGGALES